MRRLTFVLLFLLMTSNCLALQKNVASQKWVVFAFDLTDNTAKTGDAAQITAEVSIDGAAGGGNITDTNPTELEDGYYVFDLDQSETNGDYILILPESSTGSIQVIGAPMAVWTTPPFFPTLSIDSNGRVDIAKWIGTAVTLSTGNKPDVNIDEISDDTTAPGNLELRFDGTGYAGGTTVSQADITKIGGVTQSATDLKDFADAGYDPATDKVTGVLLTDTVTTYTGNTKQTADHTAGIADIPTVAEFEARSIVSADYVVVGDTLARVTLTDTVTTYTGNTKQTANNNTLLVTIEGQTDDIGVAGVGLTESGGTGDQLTAINLPNQAMDIIGNITGNLSGSVGSVTGTVALGKILTTAVTEGNSGDLANSFTFFFDVNPTTTKTVDDVGSVATGGGSSLAITAGNLGDYKTSLTVYFLWRTVDQGGAAVDPSTAGTIRVYKADGTSEVTAPTGITDTRGFDGLTGIHLCIIDLSANTFYDIKQDYSVVLTGATIDSQSVTCVIATFGIENRFSEPQFIIGALDNFSFYAFLTE